MVRTIKAKSGEDVIAISARARDFDSISTIIIRILESASQRAFIEQRLGEHVWPRRYPWTKDPFVNKAALVNWLNAGGNVLERFFDRRPALMGTGNLANSISGRTRGGSVEVGSALPYAGLQNFGGTSDQPISQTAKRTLGQWLGWERDEGGMGMGDWQPKKRRGARQKEREVQYGQHLLWMLWADELETEVIARPFLGVTDTAARDIAEGIESFVAGGEAA